MVRFSTRVEHAEGGMVRSYTWEGAHVRGATAIFGEPTAGGDGGDGVRTVDTVFRERTGAITELVYREQEETCPARKEALQKDLHEAREALRLSYHLGGQKVTSVGVTFFVRATDDLGTTLATA